MRIQVLASIAILSIAAASPGSAAPAGDSKKANPGEKMVCKSERFVGSRIPQRICKTRTEWEQARASARDTLQQRESMKPEGPKGVGVNGG